VLRSLESDPEHRYRSARELAQALRSGLAGRGPLPIAEDPTRALGATEATRRIATDPATPVSPAPVPPRRQAPRRQPVAAPRQGRSFLGRLLRAIGVLLLIALLAAAIAGAVLLITDAGQDTGIGEFLRDNVPDQIQELRNLIEDNTG